MAQPEPFFLSGPLGRRFCVHYAADSSVGNHGAILYVHPFAEEMNKARRMAALQARALAAGGFSVLQMDLLGCGDSEGDFGDADWMQWLLDVEAGLHWLRERTGIAPALWGLRTGCLLACEAAKKMDATPDLLLWQPTLSGRPALQQFLRLKVASQIIGEASSARLGTQQLREQLGQGVSVEIGGYMLSPALALGLEAAELTPPHAAARVAWLEVASTTPAELSPAARMRIASWEAAGQRVDARAVSGPAFWQTQEIEECPELVQATMALIEDWRR